MSTFQNKTINIPLLAIRGLVLFEQMTLHFDVGRKKSVLALKDAMQQDRRVFITAQQDPLLDDPSPDELYPIGVVATIKQLHKEQDGGVHVVVTGDFRAKITDFIQKTPYPAVTVTPFPLAKKAVLPQRELDALMRLAKELFERYSTFLPKMSREVVMEAQFQSDPVLLFQAIAFNVMMQLEDRQQILEERTIEGRLGILVEVLERECEILALEQEIYDQVKEQMDKNQHDYYLREQLRVIEQQLGEGDDTRQDAAEFAEEIEGLRSIADEDRVKLAKEAERLMKCPPQSQEAMVIRTYLEHCLDLPWDCYSKESLDLTKARRRLDRDHEGMDKVKDRILEYLAVCKHSDDYKGQILCLAGPPGVGKTSIAKSIAKTIGREYVRISLGGVRDESDIRGHRKTYIGAMPGRIINAIKQAQTKNPLILLDEIDKMGHDFRGDPSSALLEVLDPEQNHSFRDHYLEVAFDLSDVLFLTTANDVSAIPRPLLDRMEVLTLSSYTREEKFQIAKKYLVPKQRQKHGLQPADIFFPQEGLCTIIDHYTREAGVRNLERTLATVCRKVVTNKVSMLETDGEDAPLKKTKITPAVLETMLGPKRYDVSACPETDLVGVVTGLAWTSVGGEALEIEVDVYEGSGKIKVTGNLGEVMKESAQLAVSYLRGKAADYGIDPDFYKTKDLHIHAPEGAVPKDGPSAGVTITTALCSALSGVAVRRDIAMTGEISLRGRVMKIGGLKEKAIAAHRMGITTVLIPADNRPDIEEFDEIIQEQVRFIPVRDLKEVLQHALVKLPPVFLKSKSRQEKRKEKAVVPPPARPLVTERLQTSEG